MRCAFPPYAYCRLGLNMDKRRCRKIQPIDKSIDEAHRIVRADIIVNRLRQEEQLGSVVAREVRHATFYRVMRRTGIHSMRLFTQSARYLQGRFEAKNRGDFERRREASNVAPRKPAIDPLRSFAPN